MSVAKFEWLFYLLCPCVCSTLYIFSFRIDHFSQMEIQRREKETQFRIMRRDVRAHLPVCLLSIFVNWMNVAHIKSHYLIAFHFLFHINRFLNAICISIIDVGTIQMEWKFIWFFRIPFFLSSHFCWYGWRYILSVMCIFSRLAKKRRKFTQRKLIKRFHWSYARI